MFIFPSLISIVKSKKGSGKHRRSKLWVLIKASVKGILIKSWAARPFKFQWENLKIEDFLDEGLFQYNQSLPKVFSRR